MAGTSALAIRTVHVLSLAVLLGGSTVAWMALRESPSLAAPDETGRADAEALALARRFEWLFWAALGLVVLTGVGNLGAVGVPSPGTDQGTVLAGKLLVVLALVAGSAVRTFVVVRAGDRRRPTGWQRLAGRAYGATGLVVLGLVVLGEVLAHG